MKILYFKNADDCIDFARTVNPHKEHLTIDKLRTFPGCENYSDQQADSTIQSLERLAVILFEHSAQKQTTFIDNQQDVSLGNDERNLKEPVSFKRNKTNKKAA